MGTERCFRPLLMTLPRSSWNPKKKEAFVRKNAPDEQKSSERGLAVFVTLILLLVAFGVILLYLP